MTDDIKLHHQPTKEELEEQIKKTTEELENIKPEDEVKEEIKEEKEEVKEEVTEEKEEDEVYKKKFIESTREAQILHAKNKKVNEALDKAMSINDVDEEELRQEYPNWDEMEEWQQKIAKKGLVNDKRIASLAEISKETKDIEAWNAKIDTFLDDPKSLTDYPELEGKIEEFRLFSTKPTRRGVDFEDLVSSFLFNREKTRPAKNSGSMFETGTGGDKTSKPKSDKLSIEQARSLRQTDYNKWKEYLNAGKIESEL